MTDGLPPTLAGEGSPIVPIDSETGFVVRESILEDVDEFGDAVLQMLRVPDSG